MALRRRNLLLLVTPLLLAGCGLIPGLSSSTGGTGTETGGVTADNEWHVVAQGSATPSPRPSRGASPTPAATGGFLPPAPVVSATPSPTCAPDTPDFARVLAPDLVPGTTSAKISWYDTGGYNLVEYRVTAISQDLAVGKQRDVGWVTVKPTAPCGPISVTLPNLDRRTSYIFTVDAVVARPSGNGSHAATIFRSSPVYTK